MTSDQVATLNILGNLLVQVALSIAVSPRLKRIEAKVEELSDKMVGSDAASLKVVK